VKTTTKGRRKEEEGEEENSGIMDGGFSMMDHVL
jgi:hypothetical protein